MNKRAINMLLSSLLVLAIMLSFYASLANASSESESISSANSSINQAFTNVLAAQKMGANVTSLLIKLNIAGEFLAQAENYYNAGNSTKVTSNADSARSIADQVKSDALNSKNDAITRSQSNLLLACLFSISAALILVTLLLLIWRRFKRSYMKKILELEPQVVENAS